MDCLKFVKDHRYKMKVDKLASLTSAYKSLAVFVRWFLRTWQTKFFGVSIEYIKCVHMFWDEIHSENCQLFESFLQISIYLHLSRKVDFLCESTSSVALIFHHNLYNLQFLRVTSRRLYTGTNLAQNFTTYHNCASVAVILKMA